MSEKSSGLGWFFFLALLIAVGLLINGVKDDIHKSSDVSGTAVAATPAETDDSSLAKSANRGIETAALFANSKRKVWFLLSTSWIPGETNAGVMRYRIEGFPVDSTKPAADSIFLQRVMFCRLSADITDNQDFKLRTIPLQFVAEQNDDHETIGLESNDSVPMSKTEYRSIAQTNPAWSLTWRCP